MITRRKSSVQASHLKDAQVKTADVGKASHNLSNEVDYENCDAKKLSNEDQRGLNSNDPTSDKGTLSSSVNHTTSNQRKISPSWEFKPFSQHKELFESGKGNNVEAERESCPTNISPLSSDDAELKTDSLMGNKTNNTCFNETKKVALEKNPFSLLTKTSDNIDLPSSAGEGSSKGDASLSDNLGTLESPEVVMRQVFNKIQLICHILFRKTYF